jgi:hypothetical protein
MPRAARGGDTGAGSPVEREPEDIDPPPWGTWPRLYAAVLFLLAVLIALFTWFTRAFA